MLKSDLLFPTTKAKAIASNYNRKILAVALYDGSVIFINTAARRIIHSVNLCKKPIRTLKFIQDTSKVICGLDTGDIIIYDLSTQEVVYKKTISSEYIRKIIVHGKILFVGCDDGSIKVYFIKDTVNTSLKFYTELKGSNSYVMDLKLYKNRLFAGYLDGNINVYDLETLGLIKQLHLDENNLNCFELYNDNETLVVFAGFDKGVIVKTDYKTGKNITFSLKEIKISGDIINVKTNISEKTIDIYTNTGINYTSELNTFKIPTTSSKLLDKLKRNLIGFSVQIGCVWDIYSTNSKKNSLEDSYVVHVGENGVSIQMDKKPEFLSLRLTDSVLLIVYGLEIYRLNLTERNNTAFKTINIDTCYQSKNFTKIGDISSFPTNAFISSSGRYICLVFNKTFTVYTTRTFIKKLEGNCEDVVFLNEDVVVLDNIVKSLNNEKPYSIINVFKGFELESTLKLENKSVVKLFGGKMLGVYYKSMKKSFFEIFTENEYTSILTLPGIVEQVVWGNKETNECDVILISKTFSYLIKLTPGNEKEKMKVVKEIDTQNIGFINNKFFLYKFSSIQSDNYELNNMSYILDCLGDKETPILYNTGNKTLLIENKDRRTLKEIQISEEWIKVNSELTSIFYEYKTNDSLTTSDKDKIYKILNKWDSNKFNKLEQLKLDKVKTFLNENDISIEAILKKEKLNEEDKHTLLLEGLDAFAKEIIVGNKQQEIKNLIKHDMLNQIHDKYTKIEMLSIVKDYNNLKLLGERFKESGDFLEAKMCFLMCGKLNKENMSFIKILKRD